MLLFVLDGSVPMEIRPILESTFNQTQTIKRMQTNSIKRFLILPIFNDAAESTVAVTLMAFYGVFSALSQM